MCPRLRRSYGSSAGISVSLGTYTSVWRQVRAAVFTPAQLRSPLARVHGRSGVGLRAA